MSLVGNVIDRSRLGCCWCLTYLIPLCLLLWERRLFTLSCWQVCAYYHFVRCSLFLWLLSAPFFFFALFLRFRFWLVLCFITFLLFSSLSYKSWKAWLAIFVCFVSLVVPDTPKAVGMYLITWETLTVHFVTSLENSIFFVNWIRISAELSDIFIQVPALILIHKSEHYNKLPVYISPCSWITVQDTYQAH